MSVLETALVFGAIPAGVVVVLALLVFAPSAARTPRYRPGRPWDYAPVWYIPHPVSEEPAAAAFRPAVGAGPGGAQQLPPTEGRPAMPADHVPASVLDEPVKTARGGAHGSW